MSIHVCNTFWSYPNTPTSPSLVLLPFLLLPFLFPSKQLWQFKWECPPWGLQKWPLSPSLKTGAVCRCPVLLALGLLLQAPHLHLLTTFPATVNSHPLELWAKVNPSFYNCLGCAALSQERMWRLLLFRRWIQRAVYVAFQPLLQNSGLTCG